jgi:hypothetical protein
LAPSPSSNRRMDSKTTPPSAPSKTPSLSADLSLTPQQHDSDHTTPTQTVFGFLPLHTLQVALSRVQSLSEKLSLLRDFIIDIPQGELVKVRTYIRPFGQWESYYATVDGVACTERDGDILSECISSFLASPDHNFLSVCAPSGYGKSSLFRFMMRLYWRSFNPDSPTSSAIPPQPLPLLLDACACVQHATGPRSIDELLTQLTFTKEHITALKERYRIVLLVDDMQLHPGVGLSDVFEHFGVAQCPRFKVIAAFLSSEVSGMLPAVSTSHVSCQLNPLDDEQVDWFLQKMCAFHSHDSLLDWTVHRIALDSVPGAEYLKLIPATLRVAWTLMDTAVVIHTARSERRSASEPLYPGSSRSGGQNMQFNRSQSSRAIPIGATRLIVSQNSGYSEDGVEIRLTPTQQRGFSPTERTMRVVTSPNLSHRSVLELDQLRAAVAAGCDPVRAMAQHSQSDVKHHKQQNEVDISKQSDENNLLMQSMQNRVDPSTLSRLVESDMLVNTASLESVDVEETPTSQIVSESGASTPSMPADLDISSPELSPASTHSNMDLSLRPSAAVLATRSPSSPGSGVRVVRSPTAQSRGLASPGSPLAQLRASIAPNGETLVSRITQATQQKQEQQEEPNYSVRVFNATTIQPKFSPQASPSRRLARRVGAASHDSTSSNANS